MIVSNSVSKGYNDFQFFKLSRVLENYFIFERNVIKDRYSYLMSIMNYYCIQYTIIFFIFYFSIFIFYFLLII